jgi:hypothetical protein
LPLSFSDFQGGKCRDRDTAVLIMVAVVFGRGAAVGLISCVLGLIAAVIILVMLLGSHSHDTTNKIAPANTVETPPVSGKRTIPATKPVRPIWLDN